MNDTTEISVSAQSDYPEILTLEEVAKYLRVPLEIVVELVESNKMPVLRVGDIPRMSMAVLQNWIHRKSEIDLREQTEISVFDKIREQIDLLVEKKIQVALSKLDQPVLPTLGASDIQLFMELDGLFADFQDFEEQSNMLKQLRAHGNISS